MLTTDYRDSIFRNLFNNNEAVRELVNAIGGTNYGKDAKIKIYDLDSSLYTRRANDLSFTIDDKWFVFVEQQSTVNPNMPYRMLQYFADSIGDMCHDSNFYSSMLQRIVSPEFYVLYNGKEEYSGDHILKLSDMYKQQGEIFLELKVKLIDIRHAKEYETLDMYRKSSLLYEYSRFCEIVLEETERNGWDRQTVLNVLKRCENENILRDYLKEHGGGAVRMAYETFNMDELLEWERKVYKDAGKAEGETQGKLDIVLGVMKSKDVSFDDACSYLMLSDEDIEAIRQLYEQREE